MADVDERVAQHYKLETLNPDEWPASLDASDDSGDEARSVKMARRSRSRYFALRGGGERRISLASQRSGDRADTFNSRDEPDPLGNSDSLGRLLNQRGALGDDEARIKNRLLLSSTTFSPALFLSQAHSDDSMQSLLQGLDYLSRSIDQKSASLKVLVESNFERFVRAKATIDNVYTEMRNQGAVIEFTPRNPPMRSANRPGTSSGGYNSSVGHGQQLSNGELSPRRNALMKESEYGIQGIRSPLLEAAVRAEEVWGQALGEREREEGLKAVVDAIEKNRGVYEIGATLESAIRHRDYEAVVDQYTRARRYANEAKRLAERSSNSQRPLTDAQTHTVLVTGRMWMDVQTQIQDLKKDLWRRLSNTQSESSASDTGRGEEYMELIAILLELGVDDNPIWVWLLGRYDYLKTRITAFCDRSKVEIEILRRRLANAEKPSTNTFAFYVQKSEREGASNSQDQLDTDSIVEFWESVHMFLKKLLSAPGGLVGDIVEFWEIAQSFMDGTKQKLLPSGFEGESRKYHRLSTGGITDLKDGVVELVNLIRENILSFFVDPPTEDISLLFTPVQSQTPNTPVSGRTPTEPRFKFDVQDIPPPSPRRGEPWEDFAFWPPYSNSLSGIHYLSRFLILIGTAASEMAAMGPISSGKSTTYDNLKLLVSDSRERSVRAVSSAWNTDAEGCKYLEDWTRDPSSKEQTNMPRLFVAFESSVLSGMQKILYISEAKAKSGAADIVSPPPTKLLQTVRSQFVNSVYKSLSGLVENAENPLNKDKEGKWVLVGSDTTETGRASPAPSFGTAGSIDSKNKNVRILLTLSNLRALRADHVPQLVSTFETSFSVKLTEESKTINDVLDQIDARLLESYIQPIVKNLNSTILKGIRAPDWEPGTSRPDKVRPYVYKTMLTLVMVHTEVTTTLPVTVLPTSQTSPGISSTSSATAALTTSILSDLLTQVSSSLLEGFTSRQKYTLPALMQATLDTEFIAQTMSQYSSNEASNIQSQIYLELDRRTNNEARAKLQAELSEMRGVLKKLRESTKGEFACFKKPRSTPSK